MRRKTITNVWGSYVRLEILTVMRASISCKQSPDYYNCQTKDNICGTCREMRNAYIILM
jgi:hypothetical protein